MIAENDKFHPVVKQIIYEFQASLSFCFTRKPVGGHEVTLKSKFFLESYDFFGRFSKGIYNLLNLICYAWNCWNLYFLSSFWR